MFNKWVTVELLHYLRQFKRIIIHLFCVGAEPLKWGLKKIYIYIYIFESTLHVMQNDESSAVSKQKRFLALDTKKFLLRSVSFWLKFDRIKLLIYCPPWFSKATFDA